jgi:DNA polymerase III alpha subunit
VSEVLDDYRYLGLTLGDHPLALLRAHERLGGHLAHCHSAAELESCRHGQFVRVAGLVTGRQRPGTATGVLFVTLEDETGNVNLVVWASVLEQFRAALLQGQLLRVKGVVEREREVIHVVAGHVEDATWLIDTLASAAGSTVATAEQDKRMLRSGTSIDQPLIQRTEVARAVEPPRPTRGVCARDPDCGCALP